MVEQPLERGPEEASTADGAQSDEEFVCRQCGNPRPRGEFWKSAKSASGYLNVCPSCMKVLAAAGSARTEQQRPAPTTSGAATAQRPALAADAESVKREQQQANFPAWRQRQAGKDTGDLSGPDLPVHLQAARPAALSAALDAPAVGRKRVRKGAQDVPAAETTATASPRVAEPELPARAEIPASLVAAELPAVDGLGLPEFFALTGRPQIWVAGDFAVLWDGQEATLFSTAGTGPKLGLTPDVTALIVGLVHAPQRGRRYW